MKQPNWFERDFSRPVDPRLLPALLERLLGTPARLEEKLAGIAPEWLTTRVDGTWTIQENVGHLADLEPLWLGRLEDIVDGAAELRSTDLNNEATTRAGHNAVPLAALLQSFRQQRLRTVHRLQALSDDVLDRAALHPRLRTPMRPVDLFAFVAEHDDHHLARISALARQLAGAQAADMISPAATPLPA
ncbi:DinB family protein [Hymenobacter sp. 15J16-1T3B]|uniref:DinB family protein n=1 Tax=Hymenobacter sp. 15J16-1T3B TaxID=2886941 RepID=UPI001D0F56CD|nr:DinB family protein [Hymenobacter sp. 15J16-1T3B]MCC3156703.1 DinB family protein [Hymenobacter sp. 15J16-1T3B]